MLYMCVRACVNGSNNVCAQWRRHKGVCVGVLAAGACECAPAFGCVFCIGCWCVCVGKMLMTE